MVSRCTNPLDVGYKRYGGRGIKVCQHWLGRDGFANFIADMGERPIGMTIDRFPDRDGNYEPTNCRWATAIQQARTSSNTRLTFDLANEVLGRIEHGETRKSVAARLGVSVGAIVDVILRRTWRDAEPVA